MKMAAFCALIVGAVVSAQNAPAAQAQATTADALVAQIVAARSVPRIVFAKAGPPVPGEAADAAERQLAKTCSGLDGGSELSGEPLALMTYDAGRSPKMWRAWIAGMCVRGKRPPERGLSFVLLSGASGDARRADEALAGRCRDKGADATIVRAESLLVGRQFHSVGICRFRPLK